MDLLALLPPVAAALPGKQGPPESRLARRRARLAQAAVAVLQKGAGNLRQAQVEQGKDEELVPEDMAPVGLAVPAAGGNPHVEVHGVQGDGLQEMKDVQAQH